MKNWKILAAAALLLVLSALKWEFPGQAERFRQQALEVLGHSDSRTEWIGTLGSLLTEEGLGDRLLEVLGPPERETAAPETESAGPDLTPFSRGYDDLLAGFSGAPAQTAMAEPAPEAVSAFLEQQKQYEEQGYPLPAKVRSDMPELPFDAVTPVEGADSSGFGYRVHPIQGGVKFHYGTDLAADEGSEVRSFAEGRVSAAGTNEGYGNYLILEHAGGFSTLYAHLSAFVAREGDRVERGQTIARVGHTGNATGPHLHFELQLDGNYLNPEYYL